MVFTRAFLKTSVDRNVNCPCYFSSLFMLKEIGYEKQNEKQACAMDLIGRRKSKMCDLLGNFLKSIDFGRDMW